MIEIIPAIDILDGCCVRLEKGRYESKTVYASDPVAIARRFYKAGYQRLHIVDLDGVKAGKPVNLEILKQITASVPVSIDYSGGLRTAGDVSAAFASGAAWVILGSIAVRDPELCEKIIAENRNDSVIIGADVSAGMVTAAGWTEDSRIPVMRFIKQWVLKGIVRFMCTDVEKDGMMQGPNIHLYNSILAEFPEIKLIASGGISCMADVQALESAGVPSVIVGKAFYEKVDGFEF